MHILIEEKRYSHGLKCCALKRQGVDLLGGRALRKVLHPFMAKELKNIFNLQEALLYGLVPIRFGADNPAEILSSILKKK